MNRRNFFKMLGCLPLLGFLPKIKAKPIATTCGTSTDAGEIYGGGRPWREFIAAQRQKNEITESFLREYTPVHSTMVSPDADGLWYWSKGEWHEHKFKRETDNNTWIWFQSSCLS